MSAHDRTGNDQRPRSQSSEHRAGASIAGTRPWSGDDANSTDAVSASGTRPYSEKTRLDSASSEATPLPPVDLQQGAYLGERYRVRQRLHSAGGEAELYLCDDENMPEGHADRRVVVKLYNTRHRPKPEVLELITSLVHPHLIRILDTDAHGERFFEVLEYCRGGSMADAMPYPPDGLYEHLDHIVEGLNFCHESGIVHRDIKPTNLLFRDTARTDLVLTDFGISSHLHHFLRGGPSHSYTGTTGRYTLQYAAPEMFGMHKVDGKIWIGFPTDYYSLGITVLHLALGRSPFQAMEEGEIYSAHIQNRIDLPETLAPELRTLVRGLIQYRPANRWGYQQYRQWRDGVPITREDGRPWQHQPYTTVGGFQFYPAATTPEELAWKLDEFDAAEALTAGYIDYWVAHFDRDKAKRIRELKKHYEKNPELTMKQLAWYLDPMFPPPWQPNEST